MSYFSKQPNELSQPVQIADSDFFVETKLNANSIVKRSHELMGLFGYKEGDLDVSAGEYFLFSEHITKTQDPAWCIFNVPADR